MAERSTPESRRRARYKQMQAYTDEEERKRGAITKRQDEAYARHLRTGETTLLDKHGKQYIPPAARARLAEESAARGKGWRGREAAAMVGAAELATLPFGIGLKGLIKGFTVGHKSALSLAKELARKAALKKQGLPASGVVGRSRQFEKPLVAGRKATPEMKARALRKKAASEITRKEAIEKAGQKAKAARQSDAAHGAVSRIEKKHLDIKSAKPVLGRTVPRASSSEFNLLKKELAARAKRRAAKATKPTKPTKPTKKPPKPRTTYPKRYPGYPPDLF